jgi:hypothetical protein
MIDWLMEPFQHPFNQRAVLAALMIGFTNGYASAFVVLKKSAVPGSTTIRPWRFSTRRHSAAASSCCGGLA